MVFTWDRKDKYLHFKGSCIRCSCVVRNELNGWRPREDKPPQDEVVHTIPTKKPYMPREFPEGKWEVGRPKPRTHPYKAPFYIPTTAYRTVKEWDLDDDGGYESETDRLVRDEDYGLHCSTSGTTLGCVKIHRERDLLRMAQEINRLMDHGEEVYFEVT